jgi:hypothetical protein
MIPKIIHYCWLSDDPVPEAYQKCMATWREKLPAYEFMLWDTKRFDINSVLWTKQAFETNYYAFAADYIRLYAVYHCGGIYLDMDVEAIKPFESLLDAPVMLAYENHINDNIEAGCFGAEKGHPYIRKCMEYFETRPLFDPSLMDEILKQDKEGRLKLIKPLILPIIMKNTLLEQFKNETYTIYPCDYFTAKNIVTGKIEATEHTYTIHHFATDYHSEQWRREREQEQKIAAVFGERSVLTKLFVKGISLIRKIVKGKK